MPPKDSLKRKDPPKQLFNGGNARSAKRARAQDARAIRTQSSDKAINEKGELDVGAFVKARQFEIEALEQSFKSSKHGLMSRAFQEVPRQLRRRTASHNVKKVPKRLRARAAREIKDDNTLAGTARKKDLTSKQWIRRENAKKAAIQGAKSQAQREALVEIQKNTAADPTKNVQRKASEANTATVTKGNQAPSSIHPVNPPQSAKGLLARPPKSLSRFKKRQEEKTWLPTHFFHAKRAHMTPPNQPLWRYAIPLSPTEKSYRITHRAANMRGCIAWDASYMNTIMLEGEATSLLGALRGLGVPETMLTGSTGLKWRSGNRTWTGWLAGRDDPSVWLGQALIIWCAENSDDDHPMNGEGGSSPRVRKSVLLRIHPSAFLQTWKETLKVSKMQRPQVSIQDLRYDIGSIEIEGPASTEALAGILHPSQGSEQDQRLDFSKTLLTMARISTATSLSPNVLLNLSIEDPRLKHPPRKLDLNQISDQDLIDLQIKWPGDSKEASGPGSIFDSHARYASCQLQSSQKAINRRHGEAGPGNFPRVLSSDPRIPVLLCPTVPSRGSHHGTWTLMLPWNWVLPVWNSLMYFPLSTGNTPRFGGFQEKHQLSFEHEEPFFPADYPGTNAGWEWEKTQRKKRQEEHERKPKAKRVEYSKLDLGNGQKKGEIGGEGWSCAWERLCARANGSASSGGAKQELAEVKNIRQVIRSQLHDREFTPTSESIVTVRLQYIQRGVPSTCARIYRLPTTDIKLRARWTELLENEVDRPDQRKLKSSKAIRKDGKKAERGESASYPPVPSEVDLIGFVTTGNFNLAEGKGTAIGGIALHQIWIDELAGRGSLEGICIVRNSGTSYGRLARWSST